MVTVFVNNCFNFIHCPQTSFFLKIVFLNLYLHVPNVVCGMLCVLCVCVCVCYICVLKAETIVLSWLSMERKLGVEGLLCMLNSSIPF